MSAALQEWLFKQQYNVMPQCYEKTALSVEFTAHDGLEWSQSEQCHEPRGRKQIQILLFSHRHAIWSAPTAQAFNGLQGLKVHRGHTNQLLPAECDGICRLKPAHASQSPVMAFWLPVYL